MESKIDKDMQPAQSLPPDVKQRAISYTKLTIVLELICVLVFAALGIYLVTVSKEFISLAVILALLCALMLFVIIRAEITRINCLRDNQFSWKESIVGEGMFEGRRHRWAQSSYYYRAKSVDGEHANGINPTGVRRGDSVYDIEIFAELPLQIGSRFQIKK